LVTSSILASDLWIVIPAFNEAQVIGSVIGDVGRFSRHVVVVDDCSTDGTAAVAAAAGATAGFSVRTRGNAKVIERFPSPGGAKPPWCSDMDY